MRNSLRDGNLSHQLVTIPAAVHLLHLCSISRRTSDARKQLLVAEALPPPPQCCTQLVLGATAGEFRPV